LLPSDIGQAVRLLEECRLLPDTKPADIEQFVNDVSSGAPGAVAIDGDRIIGVIQARVVSDDGWINVVAIDPAWRPKNFCVVVKIASWRDSSGEPRFFRHS